MIKCCRIEANQIKVPDRVAARGEGRETPIGVSIGKLYGMRHLGGLSEGALVSVWHWQEPTRAFRLTDDCDHQGRGSGPPPLPEKCQSARGGPADRQTAFTRLTSTPNLTSIALVPIA